MIGRPRKSLSVLLVPALAAVVLPMAGATAADKPDPEAVARGRLNGDASGHVRIVSGRSGRVGFVGTRAAGEIDNPTVAAGASVAEAARAHLDRYGAVLGATGDTTFVRRSVTGAVSGTDVVTYTQEVDGVPVIGGDVVISVADDRGLRSIQSTISGVGSVGPATVTQQEAAAVARRLVGRSAPADRLETSTTGRWLLDPEVVDVSLPAGARTVWRFEVGDGAGIRQLVLVDDQTGQVLLHGDLIEHADPDRVVCDRANARGYDTSCTSGFARVEGGAASAVADVNDAYDLSGAVSDFYRDVAGLGLTQLLGVNVGGVKKLASTVRFCTLDFSDSCPYHNAFWNGWQMFYGAGWAGADDVVGHEMTHGVIDKYSMLFYWGQSGAINESLADVIGEIVDHRNPSSGDAPDNWDLGEDSPVGVIRNLADPTAHGQPDRTTSDLYDPDSGYLDNGGVHANSGVGNKTAYLISQGGTFNGQTIAGIDGSDATLAKTARLYVDVIERLSSGADYADLARQLDQSCGDLQALGTAGFTTADCVAVHQAGVATELTTTPTNAAQPADAPTGCPANSVRRMLFDSETDWYGKFVDSPQWSRTGPAGWSNATSGTQSWFADDPSTTRTGSLRVAYPVDVPPGQPTFMTFEGWHLLDYENSDYYDGGTVEVSVDGGTPATLEGTWINGPNRTLTALGGNPNAGTVAFAGDSLGWVRSRVDLASYAGSSIQPQFTLRSDSSVGFIGWYLDDITIYTCDPVLSRVRNLRVDGFVRGMRVSWSPPAVNPGAVASYRVVVEQCSITRSVPASTTTVSVNIKPSTCGSRYDVDVVPLDALGRGPLWESSVAWLGMSTLRATRHGAYLTFKGALGTFEHQLRGQTVALQRRSSSGWTTLRTMPTKRLGRFTTTIRHRKRAYYRVAFLGGPGLVGKATRARRW